MGLEPSVITSIDAKGHRGYGRETQPLAERVPKPPGAVESKIASWIIGFSRDEQRPLRGVRAWIVPPSKVLAEKTAAGNSMVLFTVPAAVWLCPNRAFQQSGEFDERRPLVQP